MPAVINFNTLPTAGFNEAAGADPADAHRRQQRRDGPPHASMRPRGQTPRMRARGWLTGCRRSGFNEAAGADPADAAVDRPP